MQTRLALNMSYKPEFYWRRRQERLERIKKNTRLEHSIWRAHNGNNIPELARKLELTELQVYSIVYYQYRLRRNSSNHYHPLGNCNPKPLSSRHFGLDEPDHKRRRWLLRWQRHKLVGSWFAFALVGNTPRWQVLDNKPLY